jgi:hypothetical protein
MVTGSIRVTAATLALVLILGLLVGGIAGFVVAQGGRFGAQTKTAQGPCPHELSPEDAYIIAGFTCPAPICQDLLADCHCELAHEIMDRVKQELGQGKDGTTIRAELIAQYGAQLHKGN